MRVPTPVQKTASWARDVPHFQHSGRPLCPCEDQCEASNQVVTGRIGGPIILVRLRVPAGRYGDYRPWHPYVVRIPRKSACLFPAISRVEGDFPFALVCGDRATSLAEAATGQNPHRVYSVEFHLKTR